MEHLKKEHLSNAISEEAKENILNAFAEGMEAAIKGLFDNPYQLEGALQDAWASGWMFGKDQNRKRRNLNV